MPHFWGGPRPHAWPSLDQGTVAFHPELDGEPDTWWAAGDVKNQGFYSHTHVYTYGGFHKWGVPQNSWFIMEIPTKMDDLGVPLFWETSVYIYIYIITCIGFIHWWFRVFLSRAFYGNMILAWDVGVWVAQPPMSGLASWSQERFSL